MKLYHVIYLCVSLFFAVNVLAQPTPGELDIKLAQGITFTVDTIEQPDDTTYILTFNDSALTAMFATLNVLSFDQAYPAAALYSHPLAEGLLRVWRLDCGCDEANVKDSLEQGYPEQIEHLEYNYTNFPTYLPNDYTLGSTGAQGLHLDLIKAKQAWDITHGSSGVKVAVMEAYGFQPNHPDLVNNVAYAHGNVWFNPLDGETDKKHGTWVAGCVAATTDNGSGVSSVGFNTNLMLFRSWSYNDMLWAAQNGARIINCSFGNCGPPSQFAQNTINMIVEEVGTIIVAGAANGNQGCPANCSGCAGGPQIGGASNGTYRNGYAYPASYDNVISVTSVSVSIDAYGNFTKEYNQGDQYHTHNDHVDISAPGFNVATTEIYSSYGSPWGTSFASPVVAGVLALMLDANPCLTPQAAEAVLKESSDQSVHSANPSGFSAISGAGLVDAYAAVQLAQTYNSTYPYITTNTTWNDRKFFSQDVYVVSGNTLTLNSEAELWFSEGKRLIVQPGAKLVINGARLTSRCEWGGIDIESDGYYSQYPSGTYSTHHGIVDLNSGTRIENATVGVLARMGGVLWAFETSFLNNKKGVEFRGYESNVANTYSTPTKNISSILNCTFTTDDVEYSGADNAHIKMTKTDRVSIQSCTFDNELPVSATPYLEYRGIGIKANLSALNVTSGNAFHGMCYGIYATGAGNSIISNNTIACQRGVYLLSHQNARVSHNAFDLSEGFYIEELDPTSWEHMYGLYLDKCNGYDVYKNSFGTPIYIPMGGGASNKWYDYGYDNPGKVGIVVHSSGTDYNELQRNTFLNLNVAIEGIGFNRGTADGSGLHILCNDFEGCFADVYICDISAVGWVPANYQRGIAKSQGYRLPGSTTYKPAANLFSRNCEPNNCGPNMVNETQHQVNYYHHDDASNWRVKPTFPNIAWHMAANQNTGITYNPTTGCPLPDPDNLVPSGMGNEVLRRNDAVLKIAMFENVLDGLVDGGNTPLLESEAALVDLQNAYTLYAQLLQESPYVSAGVIEELIGNESGFPESLLADVLEANVHALHDNGIMEALEGRTEELPSYLMDELVESALDMSAKEYLESEIAFYVGQYHSATRNLYRSLLQDSIVNEDSVAILLSETPYWEYQLELAERYKSRNMMTLAETSFQSMSSYMTAEEDDELIPLEDIFNLVPEWDSLTGWDESVINEALTLAESEYPSASGRAMSLLALMDTLDYTEPLYFPTEGGSDKARGSSNSKDEDWKTLAIYPNPANDYTAIEYHIRREVNSTITILDAQSKPVYSKSLNKAHGQFIVPLERLATGNYICVFKAGDELLAKEKLSIVR